MSQRSLAWIRPGIRSVVTISLFSSTSVWSWRAKKLKTMIISVLLSGTCSIFTHFWKVLVVVSWMKIAYVLAKKNFYLLWKTEHEGPHEPLYLSVLPLREFALMILGKVEEAFCKLCSSLAYIGCNFNCSSMADISHINLKFLFLFIILYFN